MGASAPLTKNVVEGSFSGAGQVSAEGTFFGRFNVSLGGSFVGTALLERSFDDGTTWLPCGKDTSGTYAAYSSPISVVAHEPEIKVKYRWRCTAYTSGSINYRLSQ